MSNHSIVLIHQKTQQRYPLKSEFVIGRSTGDLVFDQDPKLSSKHCLIRATESGFAIYDLKSRTGVYINGAQLPQGRACLLKSGAEITIGDQIFLVYDEAAQSPTNWKLFLPAVLLAIFATASLPFIRQPSQAVAASTSLQAEISPMELNEADLREAIVRLEALKRPEQGEVRSDKQKLNYLREELIPRFAKLNTQLKSLKPTRPELAQRLENEKRLASAFLGEVTAMERFLESRDVRFERQASDFNRQALFLQEQLQKDSRLPASR